MKIIISATLLLAAIARATFTQPTHLDSNTLIKELTLESKLIYLNKEWASKE